MVVPMNPRALSPAQWALAAVVVVGLAIDAFVHLDLADAFAGVKTSTLSQADLFRVEAVASIVAAVALLVRPRRYTAAFAFLVAAAGTVAVVLYRYVDVGKIGPIPDMYDPFWLPTEKWVSLIGEVAATIAGLVLLVQLQQQARRGTTAAGAPAPRSVVG
jgi:hypothetical protein